MAHASGPGRYARELVRALVRLPDAPELGLYEVGRARRVVGESELGLEGARVRRITSGLPRRLRGPADLAFGGVEIFHRILPGTPRLARARATIALAELPPRGSCTGIADASAVFVFCEDYRARVAERLGVPPERIHRVPVGCEHWARALAAPVPLADPPRVVSLVPGPQAELRAALSRLGRPVELVLARERRIGESELPALLASASALVHLVPDAGTAVTPLEACALGTPVVVPRLPAFVEALGSEACWADALDEALEMALESARDPAARAARIERARAFTWERSARAHLDVWRGMTSA